MTVRQINVVTGEETETTYTASEIAAHEAAQAQEIADAPLRAIASLEATLTPRRLREHALGTGGTFVADVDAAIALERAKL